MKSWKQVTICLVVIAVAALFAWRWYDTDTSLSKAPVIGASNNSQMSGSGRMAPLVVVEPAGLKTVNDRLEAIGTGLALSTVSVTPYSNGTLRTLSVKAGAQVEKDQILAELDAETETIVAEKARIALQDAENTLARMNALKASNTTTQVQVVAAELALANSKLALQDAELALSRRTIRAPIAGVIGILPVNVGNYVTSATSIATIDDRSKVLIDLWIPERFSPQVRIGQSVRAEATALPGADYEGQISAIDNMIDEASRTLRVRAEITNPSDILRAGMSFQVVILFPGDQYPSVNPLSIQWDSSGSYVWRIRDEKAERVPARIVQRNSQSVLVDAQINEGDEIVTEGVQTVRDGGMVQVKQQADQL